MKGIDKLKKNPMKRKRRSNPRKKFLFFFFPFSFSFHFGKSGEVRSNINFIRLFYILLRTSI